MTQSLLPSGLRSGALIATQAPEPHQSTREQRHCFHERTCRIPTFKRGWSRCRCLQSRRYNGRRIPCIRLFSKVVMIAILLLILFLQADAFMIASNSRQQCSTTAFAHVSGSTEYDRYRNGKVKAGKDYVSGPANTTDSLADTTPVETQAAKMMKKPPIRHVAFICDGNSRWSKQKNLPTAVGHREGADRLVELIETITNDYPEIHFCTLYGFSTENWKRPPHEIQELFGIMEQTARKFLPRLLREMAKSSSSRPIQIRILGDFQDERIPLGLQRALMELQKITNHQERVNEQMLDKEGFADDPRNATPLTVSLAINYGGRQDILQATRKVAALLASGALVEDQVTEDILSSFLTTTGLPDPDMIVRTSGEHRLSNFLLWNSAYSELYLTNVMWPDFDALHWKGAFDWYTRRKRRFGSRSYATGEEETTNLEK